MIPVINKLLLFCFSVLLLAGLFAPLMASHDAQFYYDRGSEILSTTDPDRQWVYRWDLSSARSDFSRAIRLNPTFAAAYTSRAGIETLRGETDAAVKDYASAIQLSPLDPTNYIRRARIEAARGDFEPALDDYARVIKLQPDNRDAYRGRIRVREMQNNFTGAVTERVHMIEESVPPPSDTNEAFFAHIPDGWRDRFLRQLDRALESDANFAWGFYYRGVIKSVTDDRSGALVDFQHCQSLSDDRVKDYAAIQTWLLQARSGEKQKADQQLLAYCRDRTGGTPADWPMQIAQFLLHQTSEADFAKAIDSADTGRELSEFWYFAGVKHLLAGDKAGARDHFRKSLLTTTRSCAVFFSAGAELSALNPVSAAE
jgi:tetratricopeptide (TPR) repeat protein